MANEVRAQLKAACPELSPELFKKASDKLVRWMRAAYGSVDWIEAEAEMGLEGLVA